MSPFLELNPDDLLESIVDANAILEPSEVGGQETEQVGQGIDNNTPNTDGGEKPNETIEESAIAIMAKDLQSKGRLLEDIEITNDLTYDGLVAAVEKTFEKQNKDAVRQEIYEELSQEGITKDVIENVKRQNAGITNNDEMALNYYANLALTDLSKVGEENKDKELLAWTKHRYIAIGLPENQAELLAAKDIDDNYDGTIKANQDFFTGKWQETKGNIEKKIKDAETAKIENAKKSRADVETILDKGEVAGVKFTPDQVKKIKTALFEPTERVTVNGVIYKVTLAQKKDIERQNNSEARLLDKINLVLGIDPRVQQKKVDEKADKDAAKRFQEAMGNKGFDGTKNTTSVRESNQGVFIEL